MGKIAGNEVEFQVTVYVGHWAHLHFTGPYYSVILNCLNLMGAAAPTLWQTSKDHLFKPYPFQ